MTDLEATEAGLARLVKDAEKGWSMGLKPVRHTFDTYDDSNEYCVCLVASAFFGANPHAPPEAMPRGADLEKWAAGHYQIPLDAVEGAICGFDEEEVHDGSDDFYEGVKAGKRIGDRTFGSSRAA